MSNKWTRYTRNALTPVWYLCLFVLFLLSSFLLAGLALKYTYAKSSKKEIKMYDLKQTRLANERMDLCTKALPEKEKELAKAEKKLMKRAKKQNIENFEEFISKNEKVINLHKAIERINKKISNYDRALANPRPQDTTSEKDNKFIEKVDNKLNEVKENIM